MPLNAKLIMFNVPSGKEELDATRRFYQELFGLPFSRTWTDLSLCYYAPISIDGTMFSVKKPQKGDDDKPFPIFAVDDMKEATTTLLKEGGSLIGEPFDLPLHDRGFEEYHSALIQDGVKEEAFTKRIGIAQWMRDPAGNLVVLFQLDEHSEYAFKTGKYRVPMSKEQLDKWAWECAKAEELKFPEPK